MNAFQVERLRGKFIVLDGPDGAGKSTQHKRLEAELRGAGIEVVSCRDPGGTAIGDRIRSVLLDHDLSLMDVNCETMLFMASRAQLVSEVIKPALAAGKTVLCDRFVTSTCAYQGAAGYDPKRVIELAKFAIDCWPDATIIIDLDPQQGFERVGRKSHHAGKRRTAEAHQLTLLGGTKPADAMEARPIDFHRKVRKMFLEVHEHYPTPVVVVDGGAEPDVVFSRILSELTRVLG